MVHLLPTRHGSHVLRGLVKGVLGSHFPLISLDSQGRGNSTMSPVNLAFTLCFPNPFFSLQFPNNIPLSSSSYRKGSLRQTGSIYFFLFFFLLVGQEQDRVVVEQQRKRGRRGKAERRRATSISSALHTCLVSDSASLHLILTLRGHNCPHISN